MYVVSPFKLFSFKRILQFRVEHTCFDIPDDAPVKLIQYREKNNTISNRDPFTVIHPFMTHSAFPKTANTQALNNQAYKMLPLT